MAIFINRVSELNLIEEAFGDLLNEERLMRTPIIDFYGVEGIGKTSILEKVIEKCDENKIPYIQANVNQDLPQFSDKITKQVREYYLKPSLEELEGLMQPLTTTSASLERGPLVVLLDAVDTTDDGKIQELETLLSKLIIYNKLFVVLTSRRSISFQQNRSVARKLVTFSVQPLDRANTEHYLDSKKFPSNATLREIIFEWTRGYPLAMNEMVKGIQDGITPVEAQGRLELMTRVVDRVIAKGLLADVKSDEERAWLQTHLSLLAVPRRFNLVIMQKLIEQFEPKLKLATSLAYIVLPNKIAQATGVIGWNLDKAGFTIDEPVRNILLLQLKITQPQRYYEMNRFLAEMNWQIATEVTGPDRIRYQHEYLYHSANSVDEQQMPHILEETVTQIIQDAEQAPDQLIQFCEEFIQDKELKDDIGPNVTIVLTMIYEHLAEKMYTLYQEEDNKEQRFRYLHYFFYYVVNNPTATHLSTTLRKSILLLQQEEDAIQMLKLYEDMGRDSKFKDALGHDFAVLLHLLQQKVNSFEE